MNCQKLAHRAYNASSNATRSLHAVEYDAIAKVTHQLKFAHSTRSTNFSKFVEAIHKNNLLWNTLAANVAMPNNQLSSDLRAQIFYLFEFTQRHAAQVLAGKADIVPLLEINSAVLRGLRQSRGI